MRGKKVELEQHKRFLYIRIGVSAVQNHDVDMYGGWMESQIPAMLLRLQHMTSSISARPFPRRYRRDTALGNGFCVFIKITNRSSEVKVRGGGEVKKQMTRKVIVANGSRHHNCLKEEEEKKEEVEEEANEKRGKRRDNHHHTFSSSNNTMRGQRLSLKAGTKSVHIKRLRKRSATPPQLRNDLSAAIADIRTLLEAKLARGDGYVAFDVQLTKVPVKDFLALVPYNIKKKKKKNNQKIAKSNHGYDGVEEEEKEEEEKECGGETKKGVIIQEDGSCPKTNVVQHQNGSKDLHNLATLQLRYDNDYKYYAGNTTETKKRRINKNKNGKKPESQIERQLLERAKTKEEDCKLGLNDVSRMLTIEQMLKNLQYDNSLDTRQVTLVYHDRFKGLKEISLFAYFHRQKQGVTGDFFIPGSRIFYIKMNGKLVWDRIRKRMSANLAHQKKHGNVS